MWSLIKGNFLLLSLSVRFLSLVSLDTISEDCMFSESETLLLAAGVSAITTNKLDKRVKLKGVMLKIRLQNLKRG